MASSQAILNDVDLLYRNTFTTDQKLVWFNEEQLELFDVLEIDSEPYAFVTVENENFYPFPDQFDMTKIKVVNMQILSNSPQPQYVEIPFRRNDDNVYANTLIWYTIVSNAMFLYYQGSVDGTTPSGVPGDLNVYVYCDSEPTEVTSANLNVAPDLPTKYQEILKLGLLKRIAMARKDVLMYNNYNSDYMEKIADVLWLRHTKEPEFVQPVNPMPIRRNYNPNNVVINGW